jgi:hypothetical protein
MVLAERLAAGCGDDDPFVVGWREELGAVMDRLIRITTALAVVTVAVVAALISYQHAFELVRSHGESGVTVRLLPFTVDGLIWAASMVVLDASRRGLAFPVGPVRRAGMARPRACFAPGRGQIGISRVR